MHPSEAFSYLSEAARRELSRIQEQGAAFFTQAEFQQALLAAERAEKLKGLIQSVESLRETWAALMPEVLSDPEPPPVPRIPRQRTLPGERTQQPMFRIPILQALIEMGGRGRTGSVVDRVGELMEDVLSEFDREALPESGNIRWRNSAQWERMGMVRTGLLSSNIALRHMGNYGRGARLS